VQPDDKHLFLFDAKGSQDASAGAQDVVLMCSCGLPQQNDRHYNGLEGVNHLIGKKSAEITRLNQDLVALYLQQAKLQIREWFPLARYVGVDWTLDDDDDPCAGMRHVWDASGVMLSVDCDNPGDMYFLCEYLLGRAAVDTEDHVLDLEAAEFISDPGVVLALGLQPPFAPTQGDPRDHTRQPRRPLGTIRP
jgi:hypothetical protein